jgi:LmbE family N-acetylglucosaminyl deacetylase
VLEATVSRELLRAGVELAGALGYELGASLAPESFDEWYLPEAEITTVIDVTGQLERKRAAMQAHASQATSSAGADTLRSLAVFASLPDDYFALAFAREWFVRRSGPVEGVDDDVFAGLP